MYSNLGGKTNISHQPDAVKCFCCEGWVCLLLTSGAPRGRKINVRGHETIDWIRKRKNVSGTQNDIHFKTFALFL